MLQTTTPSVPHAAKHFTLDCACAHTLDQAFKNGLHALTRCISNISEAGKPCGLLSVSRFLAKRQHFGRLINMIMADQSAWQAVCRESYFHQNGFDKIVLLDGPNFKVRLHHFRAVQHFAPMENVHDHRWPFASTLLSGTFQMHLFKVSSDGSERCNEYAYSAGKEGGQYGAELVGPATLQVIERRQYSAGEAYVMRTDELHRILHIPGQEAMTLMVTGKPERLTCRLFAAAVIENEQKLITPYNSDWLSQRLYDMYLPQAA